MPSFNPRFNRRRSVSGPGQNGEVRLLVRYLRQPDEQYVVQKEGRGRTIADALDDADAQLRPGVWLRMLVSSPSTIYADLTGSTATKRQGDRRRMRTKYGEGVYVTIEKKVSRTVVYEA